MSALTAFRQPTRQPRGDGHRAHAGRQGGSGRQQGRGRGGRTGRGGRGRGRGRQFIQSDGQSHLGSSQKSKNRPFPGPPPDEGHPLRILPIGGLGEIGMNCMLVGARDRYILIDAGLMFPDFTDYGMQKILPDTSFLAEWRDKIEALVITHGHEDHIGALPWVVPALQQGTPIYAGSFTMQLVKRRLSEFSLFDERRFHTFQMRDRFECGPFEVEPFRVTHSIPDCCGLVIRSEFGNILHTGDWKIDEEPLDGNTFDRSAFEMMGQEGVALMMSDSTNVLSPGRTTGEALVAKNLIQKVAEHDGKGRIIATQFASNIHRLGSVKRAADAAGRKVCFVGMSLYSYLEAAEKANLAPFTLDDLVPMDDIESIDPNKLLIITTGSQGEDRAQLNLASMEASTKLKLSKSDMILYSAKVIPGNDKRVMKMFNRISNFGSRICANRGDGLHTSGHAYQSELQEILKTVKPKHFLPVHGEAAFLYAHAELAQDLGCRNTSVIRNGELLGVSDIRNKQHVIDKVKLDLLFNDGSRGTGTATDMALRERNTLAQDGVVVAAVDIARMVSGTRDQAEADPETAMRNGSLRCKVRVTTRGMWTADGELRRLLHECCVNIVEDMHADSSLPAVERKVMHALKQVCRKFNGRKPEVLVVVHEMDPRAGALAAAAAGRAPPNSGTSGGPKNRRMQSRRAPSASRAPAGLVDSMRKMNPRQRPSGNRDMSYG